MIRFENVTFGYRGRRPVLENFDLLLRPGERLCLFGPSGRGKTTVLRLLMGLEKPRRGWITGTEGLRFSAVFQDDRLIDSRTVLENAALFAPESAARDRVCRPERRIKLINQFIITHLKTKCNLFAV